MSQAGAYLYGFTERGFQPAPDLRGLRGAPVEVIGFADLAAVVSDHPVQRLMPARSNVEPHHRVVRQVSSEATLVPAAFGHVGDSQADILAVLRGNYDEIRQELARLAGKCEMGLKVRWNVENIFDHLVRTNRGLREARDRVYRGREPSMNEKLQLGAQLEATLNAERQRLTPVILAAFRQIASDVVDTPARDEKTISHTALLVDRHRLGDFEAAMRHAVTLFDASVAFEYTGPWPPYSFVRLRLRAAA
jgi:Gas vesicle synthesis protein GvpL/GvpF